MGRAFAWLIPLALIAFGLLWPLVFRGGSASRADIADPVVFSNYRAEFVVDSDGELDAVETITAEFPSGRHGIFRYWDVANPNNPRLRQIARSHLGRARRPAGALPDAVGGRPAIPGRQDR